ncbi:hypothetical protein FALCPG4_017003 [Fusarium falciforme]
MRKQRTHSRNRSPCKACQAAKRKCDQGRPQCSRCRQHNLPCEPSVQARWRIETLQNTRVQAIPGQSTLRFGSPVPFSSENLPHDKGKGTNSCDTMDERVQPDTFHVGAGRENEALCLDDGTSLAGLHDSDLSVSLSDPTPPFNAFPWPSFGREGLPTLLFPGFSCGESSSDIPGSPFTLSGLGTGNAPADGSIIPEILREIEGCNRPSQTHDSAEIGGSSSLSSTLRLVIDSTGSPELGNSNCEAYFSSLWQFFVGQVAPSITPFGSHQDNPFFRFLVPDAQRSPPLLTAVLYLSQIIMTRVRGAPFRVEAGILEDQATRVQQKIEDDDSFCALTSGNQLTDQTSRTLLKLSTVLVFCMAFLAKQDATKLILHLEHAATLCQELFRELAEDEGFLYLAKLLGFMQISLLFSTHASSVNGPDYLSAALEFHDRHSDALREIDGCLDHQDHFRDLDMFSGLSASMASIMYTLGTLLKRKAAGQGRTQALDGDYLKGFESDVDGLEARLRRHLASINKRQKLGSRNTFENPDKVSLTRCLNSFNEALFWSAWTIFSTNLRPDSSILHHGITDSSERILDACAEIPAKSGMASLILFPLVTGGVSTKKKVYHEFVLNRLKSLENCGLTDTEGLCEELKAWWDSERPSSNKTALVLSKFIF